LLRITFRTARTALSDVRTFTESLCDDNNDDDDDDYDDDCAIDCAIDCWCRTEASAYA
jgi:hypothetical protein